MFLVVDEYKTFVFLDRDPYLDGHDVSADDEVTLEIDDAVEKWHPGPARWEEGTEKGNHGILGQERQNLKRYRLFVSEADLANADFIVVDEINGPPCHCANWVQYLQQRKLPGDTSETHSRQP